MPSKLLIAASHAAHAARSSGQFGIEVRDVRIDGKAVMHRVRIERDRFVRLTQESFDEIPDGVRLRGLAKFMGTQTLSLDYLSPVSIQ